MASMPVPPGSGGNNRVGGPQQGLQLRHAEEIAAERLDGAAGGSLKEALAIAVADDAGDAAPQTADGTDLIGESFASGPLVRLIDARSAEIGRLAANKPLDAFSPMPAPPRLDVGVTFAALARVARSPDLAIPQIAAHGAPVLPPSEDWQGFVGDASPEPRTEPSPHRVPAPALEPLASALDAAVRLAADASVAAEALENLKRLVERKQQLESRLPATIADPLPAPDPDDAEAAARAVEALEPSQLPPLPLPLHAEPDADGVTGYAMIPLPPPRRSLSDRRGFDMRGFMAGFALSWAFGVVLYFFMTAG